MAVWWTSTDGSKTVFTSGGPGGQPGNPPDQSGAWRQASPSEIAAQTARNSSSGQGAATKGAGAGPSSKVSAQGQKVQKQGLDIASKAISIIGATVDFAKDAYSAMEKGFENIDSSGILDPMNAMQDIFGMSNEAYANHKLETNSFVAGELAKFKDMDNAYLSMKGTLSKSFKHKEFKYSVDMMLEEHIEKCELLNVMIMVF